MMDSETDLLLEQLLEEKAAASREKSREADRQARTAEITSAVRAERAVILAKAGMAAAVGGGLVALAIGGLVLFKESTRP